MKTFWQHNNGKMYAVESDSFGTITGAAGPLDPDDLHTCLSNLVCNAVEACIATDRAECTVTIRTFEDDGCPVFEVADTGCGMAPEVQACAFDIFYSTKGVSGTGLRLSVARKIIDEHGGNLELESIPGQGTTFRIRMPGSPIEADSASEARRKANE